MDSEEERRQWLELSPGDSGWSCHQETVARAVTRRQWRTRVNSLGSAVGGAVLVVEPLLIDCGKTFVGALGLQRRHNSIGQCINKALSLFWLQCR